MNLPKEYRPLEKLYESIKKGKKIEVREENGRRVYVIGKEKLLEDEIIELLKLAEMDMKIDLAISERLLESMKTKYPILFY